MLNKTQSDIKVIFKKLWYVCRELFIIIIETKSRMGIKWIKEPEPDPTPAFTFQNMIKYISNVRVDKNYDILQLLGRGSYAQVHRCREKHTSCIRAIKIIDRVKHTKIEPLLLGEFEVLKQMDHPNILKVYEIYEQPNYFHIITELCPGRELFDILKERKKFSEEQASGIFYQIVSAVLYMHSKGVMHRDLKPENIMYDSQTNSLKIIDFGTALRFEDTEPVQRRRVGTSYYLAPEVIDRRYNHKCDIWSLGVVLYVLLSGEPPFKGKRDEEVMANVQKGEYGFKNEAWDKVSSQAKLLITQMLNMSIPERPQANKVLMSDWLQKYCKNAVTSQSSGNSLVQALTNMNRLKTTKSNSLQGAVLVFIVNFIKKPEDQKQLQKCFKQLDLNGDGTLSLQELSVGLQKFLRVTKKQAALMAESIFKRIDTNNSGFIDYSEFLVAASNMEMTATPENIGLAFDYMDEDKNGWLSLQQIQARLGQSIPASSYKSMLKQFQKNSGGEISRKNFIATMTKIMKLSDP